MLYVANFDGNSITVYPSTVSGNVAPTRDITGSNTQLFTPHGVGLDESCNLDVDNATGSGSIAVFSAGANGNATPKRLISGEQHAAIGPARNGVR
jgi:hypothetical protein